MTSPIVLSGLQFLRDRFAAFGDRPALIWQDRPWSYQWLLTALDKWPGYLAERNIPKGSVVSLTAEFSPAAAVALLALIEHQCVVVPLTSAAAQQRDEFLYISRAEFDISVRPDDTAAVIQLFGGESHSLYDSLRAAGHPGLVLFSSGSTGTSKAVLHDADRLLDKFRTLRQAKRTIAFLSFDHIGGVNTLLHVLSNGGTVVTVPERTPARVCQAIERHRVQVLPTSPTFLNLLLMSNALDRFNVSSLDTIIYGTEVMLEDTLSRLREKFPAAQLLQAYGLAEVGMLRSKSEASNSLWVKVGGEGVETRIVDGLLQIKSHSAMLGYLNAPSPFTEDGWFTTGDLVEERDGYLRIHGRRGGGRDPG